MEVEQTLMVCKIRQSIVENILDHGKDNFLNLLNKIIFIQRLHSGRKSAPGLKDAQSETISKHAKERKKENKSEEICSPRKDENGEEGLILSGTEGNIKKDEKSRQSLKILLLQKQLESQVMILIKYN